MARSKKPQRKSKQPSRTPADDDDSDDPLALTPLVHSDPSRRRKVEMRMDRSVDRVVGGVEMPEGDLVPPSDEDEFDAWAAALVRERHAPSSPTRVIKRPPAKFSLFSDDESLEAESDNGPDNANDSSSSSDLSPPPSQSYRPVAGLVKHLASSPPLNSSNPSSPKRRRLNSPFIPLLSLSPAHHSPQAGSQGATSHRSVSSHAPLPATPRSLSLEAPSIRAPSPIPSYTKDLVPVCPTLNTPDPQIQPKSPTPQPPSHHPSPIIPSPQPPSPRPPDPVLQQYQSARTFRTRTALQLQPYTRERQVYEAVLRKGGIKKVKVVARAERSEEEFDPGVSPQPETLAPAPRNYRIVDIIPDDRTEFFVRYEWVPTDDNHADLQKIARERRRAEKEVRRRLREEARAQEEFDQLNQPSSPLHFAQMSQSPTNQSDPKSPLIQPDPLSSPSSSPPTPSRKKKRIAGRMLPAVMLKRDAEKALTKRQTSKPKAGPGRAVRRQGANVDIASMFNDEPSSDGSSSDRPPVVVKEVVSSDETSGSQAEEDNHNLTRLYNGEFDAIVRGRANTNHRRRKAPRRKRTNRPKRIRLTEKTIFSTTDFDLDVVRPQPDSLQCRIDTGVGKAKSWANLARFSVDFQISPLPSGLECTGFPVPRVANLIDTFESNTIAPIEHASHMGVVFDATHDAETLAEAVEHYFANLQTQLMATTSAEASEVVVFLTAKLLDNVEIAQLLETHLDALESYIGKIVANGVEDQREAFLATLWYVLELRLVAAARWGTLQRGEAVEATASTIFQLLLLAGFDQALYPLKMCLRGESVNGKMTDNLTSHWIAVARTIDAYGRETSDPDILVRILLHAHDTAFHLDLVGPVASERIWYTTFGICAISQFNDRGRTSSGYQPIPRWGLVRRALGMIKIAHEDEAEERLDANLFRGRDRYVRVMMARCVKLSAVWNWGFDRDTFPVITRDLGTTFKQRQYRNFPTEPAVDYPDWVTSFDIEQTSLPEAAHETAFEMYLRLVCVAASDMVATSTKDQIQLADKDIQRLIMSIIPVSPVKFNRLFPPTPRQLAQLINRYATMVAACHFSPSILPWLLANSRKWMAFEAADFDSRQITIRGLMYVAVACQRHEHSLQAIIERLSEIMRLLQREQDSASDETRQLEAQRTMVLVISCFKQIILRHSYITAKQEIPVYPDPSLLDPSWTLRIFELSAQDFRSGLEVVSAVQAFLDTRASVLPPSARRAREERLESQDEYESFGFELDSITVAQLGGEGAAESQDQKLARILEETVCPRIYRLLSDILVFSETIDERRQTLIQRLAVCWADCAAILVVDHRRLEWTTFIGAFGSQSWVRFADDTGRIQVGLHFMLSVLQLDASAFAAHSDDFISLFFSVIGTARATVEHKLISALFSIPAFRNHPLFDGVPHIGEIDQQQMFERRAEILEVVFRNMADAFTSNTIRKPVLYRLINDLVSSLERSVKAIPEPIPRKVYLTSAEGIIGSLRDHLGDQVNSAMIPALKTFL